MEVEEYMVNQLPQLMMMKLWRKNDRDEKSLFDFFLRLACVTVMPFFSEINGDREEES